jgi:hypothetical protein
MATAQSPGRCAQSAQNRNMTIRTLFSIILKVLGIFFIRDILTLIPQLLSVFLYMTKAEGAIEAIWTLLSTVLIFSVYSLVTYYLIFKADWVIDKLQLGSSFEEQTISLNIHRSTILSISVIVLGGLIIVDEVPNFCRALFSYFQEKRMTNGQTNPSLSYSVVSAGKIIIGLLLLGSQRQIVNYIELRRKS